MKTSKQLDILIACDTNPSRPWFRDRIPSIEFAINKIKWSAEIVDIYGLLGEQKYNPTIVKNRKLFYQYKNIIKANKNFENEVISRGPSVLILGTIDNYGKFLLPETVRNIRSAGIYIAGILGDDEFNYHQNRFFLGWFDVFIAYVKPCVEYYERFNLSKGYYFPNSCFLGDKEFSDYSQKTEFDVVLIGAPIANRLDMIRQLIKSNVKVAIYGSKKWKEYDDVIDCYFGFVDTEKFDETLKKSKIVLAFLEDHVTGELHMNTKIWEAVRVARLPIVTYYKPLFEEYNFQDGVDIVTYKDTADLVDKVSFYLKNDDERIRLAKSIYDKVKNDFEYGSMYESQFNSLMNLFNKRTLPSNNKNTLLDLKNNQVTFFPSKYSTIDLEVLNYIKIVNKINRGNIDLIYFDRVERGMAVVQRAPFINFDSIIFLKKNHGKLYFSYFLIKALILSRTLHIKHYCVVSNKRTAFGMINRFINNNFVIFISRVSSVIGAYKRKLVELSR